MFSLLTNKIQLQAPNPNALLHSDWPLRALSALCLSTSFQLSPHLTSPDCRQIESTPQALPMPGRELYFQRVRVRLQCKLQGWRGSKEQEVEWKPESPKNCLSPVISGVLDALASRLSQAQILWPCFPHKLFLLFVLSRPTKELGLDFLCVQCPFEAWGYV